MDLQIISKIDVLSFLSGFGATGRSLDGNSSLQINLDQNRAFPASCTVHHGLCFFDGAILSRRIQVNW